LAAAADTGVAVEVIGDRTRSCALARAGTPKLSTEANPLINNPGSAMSPSSTDTLMTTMPGDAVTVTNWYKQNVYDSSNNKIGEIIDVLVNKGGQVTTETTVFKTARMNLPNGRTESR
jgi:hypothetical protein